MALQEQGSQLLPIVVLLTAGVVAVPIFKRLGLGAVLGYFCAGLVIGPFGLGYFKDPDTILHMAELGVVMFLFIIGLEMKPTRLWAMRKHIFGLGLAQVLVCSVLLTGLGLALGLSWLVAFVAGAGFVLSSTAVVARILEERGESATPQGQQAVSILLLEDLAIVPLLAVVAFLAPVAGDGGGNHWHGTALALGALAVLFVVGRWLLNPLFAVLANTEAREVMTAAALLVVLGAAWLMELGGLSMAMGAFMAGVLLSGSSFRHQIEADIEPFRGVLLGLFFLAVGMSLQLPILAQEWRLMLMLVVGSMVVKAVGIYTVARLFGSPHRAAVVRMALFAQGGEFAFVLYAAAMQAGIFDARFNAIFSAVIILSMALTSLVLLALSRLLSPELPDDAQGLEKPDALKNQVLVIGFGRFGQIASQALLARGLHVSIIENNVARIQAATDFGFKVYYGDGTRLDILRASGAGTAQAILICVDDIEACRRMVELLNAEFAQAQLLVRAIDRGHAIELIQQGVHFQIRETFESALSMGEAALLSLGVSPEEAQSVTQDMRRRDKERLSLQITGGIYAGADLMHGNQPRPAPLTQPARPGKVFDQIQDKT